MPQTTTATIDTAGTNNVQYVYYHEGGVPGRRPVLTGKDAKPTFTELPRIDLGRLYSTELADRRALSSEIDAAFRDVGFFYATNHGVDKAVVDDMFSAMHRYFGLPLDVKMEAHSRQNRKFRGYEPLFSTKLDPATRGDLKEGFLMGEDALDAEQCAPGSAIAAQQAEAAANGNTARNQWPGHAGAQFWRPAVYRYWAALRQLSARLLRMFALALDLPEDEFEAVTRFPITNIRALHYPPQTRDEDVGIGAHTDFVFFTLLCQQETAVPALEVLNQNGVWVPARPDRDAFVVNIGDFLKFLTGGYWQSTVHRVRNRTGEERYSIPFFYSPDEAGVVSVLEKFREEGKEYEEFTAGEYFEKRLQIDRRTADGDGGGETGRAY
ncbi:Clavaminate synthase-like protein [Apiospora hydei]|uniref:Clavaminate synthase-like protein n=1 Tax=Apiospora hydei TaxID=1337664 RepID=A0ABR1V845_9PEZI